MSNVIERALADFRALEDHLAQPGADLGRDARAKLIVTLAFILTVVSYDRYAVAALLPLAAYPWLTGVAARVDWPPLLHKLLLASPFALMVGLFNPLFDTAPLLRLGSYEISGGWVSLGSILLRFALSMSGALLLVATTGVPAIATALARLGVPAPFCTQLLFLYRYAFVLGEQASHLLTAVQMRGMGRARISLRVWSALVSQLLLRSFDRAQTIHLAMLARGFTGVMPVRQTQRWTTADTRYTLAWCSIFALLRWVDLPQALGRAVLNLMP